MSQEYRFTAIPTQFFQEAEQIPFSNCTVCDCNLDAETLYIVEKAFQTYLPYNSRDLVFEYAMCMDCYESLSESFSEESSNAMRQYINERVDFVDRASTLRDIPFDVRRWLSNCIISQKPVDELDGYQFVGMFVGDQMIVSHVPCLISADVVGEIGELLSKQTLDILGGLAQQVMPSPPGYEKDIPTPAMVL